MDADYEAFLRSKLRLAPTSGLDIGTHELSKTLKSHQRLIAEWMIAGGRRACFAAFGLGKSVIQLEVLRAITELVGGRALIVAPLGVRQEFKRDATELLGWAEPPKFIRSIEAATATGIYLTNYETVRDGKLDPREFTA
ncbi:MAG: hypothetical protein LC642_04660, partial [Verrucomicrobiaceae bacterium]|nr:hypothetical protein [Verrucomicrobiaceae bacterium]